jgi:uncharacterized protein
MIGTILNCAGIIIGGVVGLVRKKGFRPSTDAYLRVVLAAFIVFYGLRLTWISIGGSVWRFLGDLLLAVVALSLGKMLGKLIGLQKLSNSLGRFARERMEKASHNSSERFNDGFLTCTALFCAAPLAILGAVQDGLTSYYYPLAAKGVIEGLAVYGFVRIFGWGSILSFLPVLAFQGTITLLVFRLEPFLSQHELVGPIQAVSGLLIFSVALVMLELKKLELADYLPSLVIAPLLAALIQWIR